MNHSINLIHGTVDKFNSTIIKIKDNVKDGIDASKDTLQSVLDVATAGPQILSDYMDGKNLTDAVNDTYNHVKGSLSKTKDSITGAVSGAIDVGISSIKAAWDLSTILPHIGIEIVKNTKLYKQIETALKKTYEHEKMSINQAIESVQNAGH